MAFTTITDSDFNGKGAASLPDQPTISAQELKDKFDEDAKKVVAPAVNRLIGELEDTSAAASVGAVAPTGRTGNTVQALLNDISSATDGKSIVTLSNVVTSGQRIATISINGANTDLKAPQGGGGGTWGTIEGTLSDQEDLQNALNEKANTTDIPDELKDLSDDSTHRLVTDSEKNTWNGKSTVSISNLKTSGVRIGILTIDSTSHDILAPVSGGGGGGDMYKSDYDPGTHAVYTAGGIPSYVSSAISGKQDALTASTGISLSSNIISVDTGSITSGETKPVTGGDVYTALGSKADSSHTHNTTITSNSGTSALDMAADTKYKLTAGGTEFIFKTPPGSDYDMPSNANILTAINNATNTNDKVSSLYGIRQWANSDVSAYMTTATSGNDTIGEWEDDWESTTDRHGWLYHADLAGILSDPNVEIEPVFDCGSSEVVSLYAMRIDDAYSYNGDTVGAVAFKFNAPIQTNNLAVGIRIKRQRINYNSFNVLPTS